MSQYFADEVMEDTGIELEKSSFSIIHNPIDTNNFNYVKKNDDQRRKILSIRPFASMKYANDLTVMAILELSKSKHFPEFEILIVGNGRLFEETLELYKFPNVTIQRSSCLTMKYHLCIRITAYLSLQREWTLKEFQEMKRCLQDLFQ